MKNQHVYLLSAVALLSLINSGKALAEPKLSQPTKQLSSGVVITNDPMSQITSVSELKDIAPTDWAYEALRGLVERYGCIVGYPDQTFRGNKSLSRWEFAAGLNACLSKLEGLIQENKISQEDIDKLKRLAQEFQGELITLGSKVDNLDERVSFLENHQFSTTTKLNGEIIFSVSQEVGKGPTGLNPPTVLNDRVRLNLTTSFTGKDVLITGLQAYNFNLNNAGSVAFPGSPLGERMANLSFQPQFAGVYAPTLTPACGNNSLCLYKLLYISPVVDKLTAFVAPLVEVSDAFPAIDPFASEGQGALSRYAGLNPVVRVSGGTSQTGLASAIGFIYNPIPEVDWRALYGSVNAAIPVNEGFPSTPLGAGLFGGSYVVSTQLTLKPSRNLDIALNYAHSYHQINITGIGTTDESTGVLGGYAKGLILLNTPVSLDSLGATLDWKFTPKVSFTTYGSYIIVNEAGGGSAYANLTS